jgi:hypothetical protein
MRELASKAKLLAKELFCRSHLRHMKQRNRNLDHFYSSRFRLHSVAALVLREKLNPSNPNEKQSPA